MSKQNKHQNKAPKPSATDKRMAIPEGKEEDKEGKGGPTRGDGRSLQAGSTQQSTHMSYYEVVQLKLIQCYNQCYLNTFNKKFWKKIKKKEEKVKVQILSLSLYLMTFNFLSLTPLHIE